MILTRFFLFALGIASIAVPLWVHLRRGRVRKRTVVSSLHLMQAARQTSRSPRRIVHWPLLLLRCLALLLLALGFGRLMIPSLGGHGVQAYAVFIIDTSGSMQADGEGPHRWDQAREALLSALGTLNPGSRVALIPSPWDGTERPWESPSDAVARVTPMEPGYAANRLAHEIREAINLLAQRPDDHPKRLHIISDFQRCALSGIDQVALPANIELRIDKVGPLRARNRGLTVSVLSAGATDIGLYGFSDGTTGEITIVDHNAQESTFAVAPGNTASRLADRAEERTWTKRRLLLEDDDALAADNVAYDAFLPQRMIPAWLFEPRDRPPPGARAQPQRRMAPSNVLPVYEQATYFIRTALQPAFDGDHAESRFRPRLLRAADLPTALTALEEPDAPALLFIPALADIPPALIPLAERIVAGGGAVLFLGGPELSPAAYQRAFAQILPVRIGAAQPITFAPPLAPVGARHPLWGGLDAPTRRLFAHVAVRERNAITLHDEARALADFTDGQPLVAERTVGKGRTYFVNTSADRQWSDWPADPSLFVPFIHLLTARALGFQTFAPEHRPLLAGERALLTLDPAHAGRTVHFNGQQRVIDASGRIANVYFDEPGIHDLRFDDGSLAYRVAVNFPPSESVLESYSDAVVLQRIESLRQTGGESVVRWEAGASEGALAWKLCLAIAALLLLVDPLMANRRIPS